MSSDRIRATQCVHIFKSELEQLKDRLDEPIGMGGLSSYLYGLWTHSSNIVIHLIVSGEDELKHATARRLDCVGYVAKEYPADMVHDDAVFFSPNRQHVIVDVSETKTSSSLVAYSSDWDVFHRREYPLHLQVNVLASESPFRRQLRETNQGVEHRLNGYENESENGLPSSSDVLTRTTQDALNEEHPSEVANENHECCRTKLYDMNGGYDDMGKDETLCHGKQLNGHKDAEADSSLKKLLTHKIKEEFELEDDKDIKVEETRKTLSLKFEHNDNQWKIQLTEVPTSDRQRVEIFFQECQALSQEFCTTQTVIKKIKEVCQCTFCNEKLQNSSKNDQQ